MLTAAKMPAVPQLRINARHVYTAVRATHQLVDFLRRPAARRAVRSAPLGRRVEGAPQKPDQRNHTEQQKDDAQHVARLCARRHR